MPILAMKIVKAEKHPNADRLRVYEASCYLHSLSVQFVANLTNVYEVGDVVAVALVGTVLVIDGEKLEIKPSVIRKVESFGMGLGKTDCEEGRNLDWNYPWPLDWRVKTLSDNPRKGKIISHYSDNGFFTYIILMEDDESIAHYRPHELQLLTSP